MDFTAEFPAPKKAMDTLQAILIIWLSVCFGRKIGCRHYFCERVKNRQNLTAILTHKKSATVKGSTRFQDPKSNCAGRCKDNQL